MKKNLIEAIDRLVHKPLFIAKKLQGTTVDNAYHRFLTYLEAT